MPKTPKPLNKQQRAWADKARAAHEEVLRCRGAEERAQDRRDDLIARLLTSGVAEFVAVNETGAPRGVVQRVGRGVR